jgi:hypothetical protein
LRLFGAFATGVHVMAITFRADEIYCVLGVRPRRITIALGETGKEGRPQTRKRSGGHEGTNEI